ncbi:hypothetical protein ACLGIH_20400 [Streptomyces sp. HMX87]|uniref:hypothetical protein n=1 Tax=Streptomyces sp. HMX87 TaxID=3390849 RepID=UPI003A8C374C
MSDEEYARFLAAADSRHDTYMQNGRNPVRPTDCMYKVVVKRQVVAWVTADGVRHVIEGDHGPAINQVRDLARKHLAADPKAQQMLADERGDIERMTAEWFPRIIGEFRGRAAPGSKLNRYPAGLTVREWTDQRYKEERARTGKQWPFIPNPTEEYTDRERAEWAAEADRYEAAFRERFPVEHRLWEFRQWWDRTQAQRAQEPPMDVKNGMRILIQECGVLVPAVIDATCNNKHNPEPTVDLRVKPSRAESDGLKRWVRLWPSRAVAYEDIPEDVRQHWDDTWAEIEKLVVQ